jgi:hypothetical protein
MRTCKNYQLVKRIRSVSSKLEEPKNIPILDQFFGVVFDIVGPFLKASLVTCMYVMVAIDHYSKWCEAKVVMDHDIEIVANFWESEVMCKFGVLKYILIDNDT